MVKTENIGQIYDTDGTTPLNYIVVIDAGSSGSRAHIFSYPDSKSVSFSQGVTKRSPDDDDDDDGGSKANDTKSDNSKEPENNSTDQDSEKELLDNPSSSQDTKDQNTPVVPLKNILPNLSKQGHKWVKKTKPGLSSFSGKPQAVGKKHLKSLLKYAMGVVPESQHYRTPIFLHATAGLRVLKPNDSNSLLDAACTYIKSHTDFLLPDCRTAVSMIDGEIEGIFGWISSNYLLGGLQDPDTFLHGKNKDHFTFGLLEMGGASTQVTFVPNVTESSAHKQNMYTLNLPSLDGTKDLSFQISSTTFLRFGVNEIHSQVLDSIKNKEDPCTPKGLVTVYDKKTQKVVSIKSAKKKIKGKDEKDDDETDTEPEDESDDDDDEDDKTRLRKRGNKVEIKGSGDYDKCQEIMTPLAVAMRSSVTKPEFDFDTNHFIGVSEYWDTAHYGFDLGGRFDHQKLQERVRAYCNSDWDSIAAVKKEKDGPYSDLDTSDLHDLCLRASWVLAVVEHGLGIPIGDLDAASANSTTINDSDNSAIHNEELENGFESPLQSANEIRGTKYSWTLGRALLYASAEQSVSEKSQSAGILSNLNLDSGHFLYGMPAYPRPKFDAKRVSDFKASDHDDDDDDDDDNDWEDYLEKHSHRLWGTLIFLLILIVIVYLLLGKLRRRQMWQSFISKFPGHRYSSNFSQQQSTQPSTFLGRLVSGISAAGAVAAGLFTGRGSGNTISNRYRRMAPDSEPVEDLELGAIDDPDTIGLEISSSSSSLSSSSGAVNTTTNGGGSGDQAQSDNFSISSDEESTRELVK